MAIGHHTSVPIFEFSGIGVFYSIFVYPKILVFITRKRLEARE